MAELVGDRPQRYAGVAEVDREGVPQPVRVDPLLPTWLVDGGLLARRRTQNTMLAGVAAAVTAMLTLVQVLK